MLSLDPTTRAEYDAATTVAGKAQAVLSALGSAVSVVVYDGNDAVMGSGVMASPWSTRSGYVLTIGEVQTFAVTNTGTPSAASWYLRFEGSGRWLRGSFGPGGSFTWSLGTWEAGQTGSIGTATATVPASTAQADLIAAWAIAGQEIAFGWTIPEGLPQLLPDSFTTTAGGTAPLSRYAYTVGGTPQYSIVSGPAGVTVNETTGLLTVPAGLPATTPPDMYAVGVGLSDGIAAPVPRTFGFAVQQAAATLSWVTLPEIPYTGYAARNSSGVYTATVSDNSPTQTDVGPAITWPSAASNSTWIPFKEFSGGVQDDEGNVYYHGGAHAGHMGSDIHKINLAAGTVTQITRPRVPPTPDDNHYNGPGSATLYRNYGAGSSESTWELYTYHNYCKNSWHPDYGFLLTHWWATGFDGSNFPLSSYNTRTNGQRWQTQYVDEATTPGTYKRFSPAAVVTASFEGYNDASDFCPYIGGIIATDTFNGSTLKIAEFSKRTNYVWTLITTLGFATTNFSPHGGNGGDGGILKHIGYWNFLYLVKDSATNRQRLFKYDHYRQTQGLGTVWSEIALPAGGSGVDMTFTVNTATNEIYLARVGDSFTVWKATYVRNGISTVTVGAFVQQTYGSTFAVPRVGGALDSTGAIGRQMFYFWNNALYFLNRKSDNGLQQELKRVVLGTQAPSIAGTKRAVSQSTTRGSSIVPSKHVNMAYCPTDGCVYRMGGDISYSYSNMLWKYHVASNTWTKIYDEEGAATGLTPFQPDDGGWYWDTTLSKFWFFWGGGGTNQSDGRASTIPGYPQPPYTEAQINATSKWRVFKTMRYTPGGQWEVVDFTFNANGTAATVGNTIGDTSRGNAIDWTTRKFYRFTPSYVFVYDLTALTITAYPFSKLDENGAALSIYYNQCVRMSQSLVMDESTGYLYGVIPNSGQTFRLKTRDPLVSGRFKIEVLPNPMVPAPNIDSSDTSGGDGCFMRRWKGGLLYVAYHTGGIDGTPVVAAWRSLTDVANSRWVPVQLPADYRANSVTTNTIATDQFLAMGYDENSAVFGIHTESLWVVG